MSGRWAPRTCAHQWWYASRACVQHTKLTGTEVVQRPTSTVKKSNHKIPKSRVSNSNGTVWDPCLLSSSPDKYLPLPFPPGSEKGDIWISPQSKAVEWGGVETVVGRVFRPRVLWILLLAITLTSQRWAGGQDGSKNTHSVVSSVSYIKESPPQPCGASPEDDLTHRPRRDWSSGSSQKECLSWPISPK